MRGPIETRLAALRGQVRRLLALHGLSWLVFGLAASILLAGTADWLIRLAPEVRLALLVGVIVLGLWLALTRVILPLIVKFADLDIALRIEDRWPGLNDRLASTVQFLRQARGDDAALGSQALRDATVEQTLVEVESIDFRQVVDPRSARKALASAIAVLALIGVVVGLEPHLSGIAFRRLFLPYGPDRWPQSTHLSVVASETPTKIARGMSFSLAVAVAPGERMPSTAKVTFRYPDGETATEALRPTEDGTFRGRLETVALPFTFTVEAGDDVTAPWSVAVVPPPALDKTDVKVIAPAYTALASQTLAPGNTQIRTVEGTKIEFRATANKPIASALLHRGESIAKEPVEILDGGRTLATAFPVKESQPFYLELKDTEGFASQEVVRFDVRVIKDEPPRVTVEEPTHDREVPPESTVPLQFAIDDDFGIQRVTLTYNVSLGHSEPAAQQVIQLWEAPQPHGEGGPVKHREVNYRWDLSTIKDLQPGSIISFHAEARDFDNIKGPNIGRSREIRLRIVTKEDAERLLDEQMRAIREEADRILAIQKQAKEPVEDANRTFSKTDKLPQALKDQLKNAEIIQRQVNNRVTNKSDGLEQKIRQFQQDARDFKANNPDTDSQMAAMREAVDRIKDNNLNPAEQALNQAVKGLDPQAGNQGEAPQTPDKPGDQPKNQPGDQPKNQAGAQTKGDQPKGAQAKGDQAKNQPGDQPQGQQAGDQPQQEHPQGGDQPKGQAGAQAKSKGQQAKGQQAKSGDQPKPAEAGGEAQDKPGNDAEAGKDAADPQGGSKSEASKAASKSGQPKASQPQGPSKSQKPTTPKSALAEADKNQKAIVDELQNMVAGLSRFDEVKDAVKDAKSLLRQQEESMKRAAEAAGKPSMTGKTPDALTPEDKADLANQAAKQNDIAKGLQNLEAKLENMASKLDATDPLAARALKDAAEQTRKSSTAAKMGEAADQLDKNQIGQARAGQEQARRDLKKMIEEMEDRRGKELSRLVAELKAAEAELKKTKDKQAANLKKTQAARQNPDAQKRADELKQLAKEQKQIQEDLKKQMAKLAKMNSQAGAKAGQKAADAMAKAQGELDQDDGEKAEGDEEEALQDLKQAQQEVAQARREAEEQLAMEQISKMRDAITSIGERQNKLVDETDKYEKARAQNDGKLTLAQRSSVRDLSRVQAGLKDEATELMERLGEGAPVFGLTLKKATDGMEAAAQRLQQLKTDEATIRAEKLASSRFQQLIDSLKPDKAKGGAQQQAPEGQPGDQAGQQRGGGDGIPAAAQIKMLRSLQQELNERTDYFDELLKRQKELNPEQTAELDKLHEDQGTLADLVRDLTKPRKDDGEQ